MSLGGWKAPSYFVAAVKECLNPAGRSANNPVVPRSLIMKPEKAKRQLERMLSSFSPGSVLMMIGEFFAERANEARAGGSEGIADGYREAEAAMNVVGFGLEALLPKPKMK